MVEMSVVNVEAMIGVFFLQTHPSANSQVTVAPMPGLDLGGVG